MIGLLPIFFQMQLYLKFGSPVRILNKSVNSLIFSPIQTVFII